MKTEKEINNKIKELQNEIGELRNDLVNEQCRFFPSKSLISHIKHKIEVREIAVSYLCWASS